MPIVLQFYPNGEFSQGVDTSASRREKDKRRDRIKQRRDADVSTQTSRYAEITASIPADKIEAPGTQYRNRRGDVLTVLHSCDEGVTLAREVDGVGVDTYTTKYSIYDMIDRGDLVPLVYPLVESSEKRESRKKLTSMTKAMARNIRNACYLLEQDRGGKDALSFLTLTLPNLSQEGLAACCERWDYLVDHFLNWLRITIKNKGGEFQYVYCTEIQCKRLQLRNEYAPHLHIVFRGRNGRKSPWYITPKQARRAWKRAISSVTGERFESSALENLQRVKYSAAGYLSKYMSKGSNLIPDGTEDVAMVALRTQWGGMARSLSRRLKRSVQRFTSAGVHRKLVVLTCRHVAELVADGYVRYWKEGYIKLSGNSADGTVRGLRVGAGCLQTPSYIGGVVDLFEVVESRYGSEYY